MFSEDCLEHICTSETIDQWTASLVSEVEGMLHMPLEEAVPHVPIDGETVIRWTRRILSSEKAKKAQKRVSFSFYPHCEQNQ